MKRFLICTLVLLVCLSMVCVYAADFKDTTGHWAENAINRWSDEKVINGYTDNTFKPDEKITRAEFVTMVVKIVEGTKVADLKAYTDVKTSDWFYDAISKAYAMGLINGTSLTTMSPNKNITRQEAVVILNRLLELKVSNRNSINKYADSNSVAAWAQDALAAFTENNFLNGYEDGTVKPEGNISRAETAALLNKTIGKIIRTAGEHDLSGVGGCVLVLAENVTLKNASPVKIVAKDETVKESLKVDGRYADEVAIATTSDGVAGNADFSYTDVNRYIDENGNNSSNDKVSVITVTTNGDVYDIKRSGADIAEGARITIVVDGNPTVIEKFRLEKASFDELKEAIKTIVRDNLDEKKVIATIDAKYSDVEELKTWERDTFEEIPDDAKEGVSLTSLLEVYEALGLSEGDVEEIALELMDNYTYEQMLSALKKI